MGIDRIDFISSYCDRWCERCAYTARCSAYAYEVAAAMYGDFAQGLELAVGTPRPVDAEPAVREGAALLAELWNVEMSPEESAAFDRCEAARCARLAEESLVLLRIGPEHPGDLLHRAKRWLPSIGVLRAESDWKRDPVAAVRQLAALDDLVAQAGSLVACCGMHKHASSVVVYVVTLCKRRGGRMSCSSAIRPGCPGTR